MIIIMYGDVCLNIAFHLVVFRIHVQHVEHHYVKT